MEDDPTEDAAHPSETHPPAGAAEAPPPTGESGEQAIADGVNPTQRGIADELGIEPARPALDPDASRDRR